MSEIPEENNSNDEENESEENNEEDNEKEEEDDQKEKTSKKSSNHESKKSETESKKSKTESKNSKDESKKSKTESQKSKTESQKSKAESQKSKTESQKSKGESKKSENKSIGSKKIITVPQKNSKVPSQNENKSSAKNSSNKLSKKSNKIIIDAGSKLATFNELLNSEPNLELKSPSIHYSEKYSTKTKKSNLPTLNQFMKSDPNLDLKTPSAHYSEKYSKYSKNSNLPTFNEYMKSDPQEELKTPSIHYSEKYSKYSKKEEKKNSEKEIIEEDGELITFEKYIKEDPEMDLFYRPINYKKRYGDIDEEEKEEIKSKKSKKSQITGNSKKSKASSSINMYQDIIKGDPDKKYKLKEIDYNLRYENIEEESQKSKKSKKSVKIKLLGNVPSERVLIIDENEKQNLSKLLCNSCSKFPLQPSVCSECKNIFCSECLKDKSKCPNCNSIYKHVDLDEALNQLFSLCRIICAYNPCGCKEQLTPNELLTHEELCKNNPITCDNCNEKMIYENYLTHYKECQLNTAECEICGYKDNVKQFEKTNQKIAHIKHMLIPEIEAIVKREVEKAVADINDSLDKREANKEPEDNKFEEEVQKKLLDIQQLLLNIQPKGFLDKKDDIGTMTKASYLDRKIKNIKLIKTLPSKIDNSFDCNNKYCVIHSFKNDNFIIYPNLKYGINSYNLSTEKDITILPNAFESNITCMSNCTNEKKCMTYFAAASYDRSIKVYSVENGFKKIKSYKEIFDDYSNFSLDLYYSNNQLILLAGNENLKQVKVLYPEESKENEKSLIKKLIHKSKILCLKYNIINEEEFFIGTEEGVHLYNIFNLIGDGEDDNKNVEPEKEYIDKNEDKAKHVCLTFIEEDKNYFIEGDSIGIVRIWSIKDAELKKKIKRGILKYQISSLDSWSGRFIIGGTKDGKLVIFDIFDEVAFAQFGEHNGYVYCVKVSENWKYEKIITSCGFDGELKIWASLDY